MSSTPEFDLVERRDSGPQFDLVEPGAGNTPTFDVVEPQGFEELDAKFSDLNYDPSDEEILRLRGLKNGQFIADAARFQLDPAYRAEKSVDLLGKAAKAGGQLALEGLKAAAISTLLPPGMVLPSVEEGAARGVRNFANQLTDIAAASPFGGDPFTEPTGETPETRNQLIVAEFRRKREEQRKSSRLASGQETLLPKEVGPIISAIAEPTSIVADPSMYLIPGIGAEAKGVSILREVAGRAIQGTGRVAEMAGEGLIQAGKAATDRAIRVAEAIAGKGTEEAAALAPTIKGAMTGTALTGLGALGVANPGTIIPGLTIAASPIAAKRTGQALTAVGRNIVKPTFSEQLGLLANVARDPNAAQWVRSVARFGQFADPAISAAGHAIEGGLHGAPVAAAITAGLGGDEDQIASSAGAGFVLGAGGRILAGAHPAARQAAIERDLTRWKSGLTPETVKALESVLPDSTKQARVMNAQKFISGMGDVDFNYLTDAQWKEANLPAGRAMQTTQGDRPVVNINVDQIGNGSPVLHEAGHVLRSLMPEQFAGLDRELFSDFTVRPGTGTDFTTGGEVTRNGLLTPEQQQKLYDQYFSKLPKEVQEQRRATWSKQDHINSMREEITSELLNSLLQDKRPDYLMNVGGVKQRILDKLLQSQEVGLLSKIPGLNRLGQIKPPTGSTIFTIDGRPLTVDPGTARSLQNILRVRDRVTRKLTAGESGEAAGITGRVSEAEMRGPNAEAIARAYGNSDTYKKDAAGNIQLSPDGRPVLLTESEVRKLQAQRREHLDTALKSVTPGPADTLMVGARELNPVRLAENGLNWEGDYFTDAQLAAGQAKVPPNIITPQQWANIKELNDAIKAGTGIRKGVDYNPATKERGNTGLRRYAAQGSKYYESVPYGWFINKEGGLSARHFDVGSIVNKLQRWLDDPKKSRHFAVWNNNERAVMADIYKYLDNHFTDRPGSVGLDDSPTVAVQKRNLITDLLGGLNLDKNAANKIETPLSTKAGRDNAYKLFRIDRINQLSPSGGDNFPVIQKKVKQNLMPEATPPMPANPEGALPTGVTPTAVIQHIEGQTTTDLRRNLMQGGAPPDLANDLAGIAWDEANRLVRRRSAPHERGYAMRAGALVESLGPSDMAAIRDATLKGGTDGAKSEMQNRLRIQSALVPKLELAGQRVRIRVKREEAVA